MQTKLILWNAFVLGAFLSLIFGAGMYLMNGTDDSTASLAGPAQAAAAP